MVTRTYQERFKTYKGVFDDFTNRNIFELYSRDYFEELLSPVQVGKESNVFLARKGNKKIIVKIYRIQNCDFNRMYDYIRKDPRYEFLKNKHREIIFAWTQREYRNILAVNKAKLNAPKVITWRSNILVEEMIGDDQPALRLKDAPPEDPQKFFELVIEQMQLLYKNNLIHGDLSAFNILNYQEKPYFIDFSQSTLIKTPNSSELLTRDINNILNFFRKLGVKAEFETIWAKITQKTKKD